MVALTVIGVIVGVLKACKLAVVFGMGGDIVGLNDQLGISFEL